MSQREQEDERALPEALNHVALLFPNAYLCAADLHDQDVDLTIDRVVLRKMRTEQGTEQRAVIHFRELDALPKDERKVFVLSAKTNAKTIAKAVGENNPRNWAGKRVTLFPTECEAFGKTVECIRVRPQSPRAAAPRADAPRPAPAPRAQPAAAPRAEKSADTEYLRSHPDRDLVTETRRRLFGAKSPLTVTETASLAGAVRAATDAPRTAPRAAAPPARARRDAAPTAAAPEEPWPKPLGPDEPFFPDEPAGASDAAEQPPAQPTVPPVQQEQPGGFFDI